MLQCWQMNDCLQLLLCTCRRKVVWSVNAVPHMKQEKGLTPVWIRLCFDKFEECPNNLLQWGQRYSFRRLPELSIVSSVQAPSDVVWLSVCICCSKPIPLRSCINSCLFRWPDCRNDFPHFWQLNGFSPEWMRTWVARPLDLLNCLPHVLHSYGIVSCINSWPEFHEWFSICMYTHKSVNYNLARRTSVVVLSLYCFKNKWTTGKCGFKSCLMTVFWPQKSQVKSWDNLQVRLSAGYFWQPGSSDPNIVW
jgi:hypothetical protein